MIRNTSVGNNKNTSTQDIINKNRRYYRIGRSSDSNSNISSRIR